MVVIQIISSLGFPIDSRVFVAVYVFKQTENYRNDIKEIQSRHKEELDKITEALNNNTLVMQQIKDILDIKEKEG